jgi:hypothetical protein
MAWLASFSRGVILIGFVLADCWKASLRKLVAAAGMAGRGFQTCTGTSRPDRRSAGYRAWTDECRPAIGTRGRPVPVKGRRVPSEIQGERSLLELEDTGD